MALTSRSLNFLTRKSPRAGSLPSSEEVIACLPTPLLLIDAEDRIRQVNAAAEALLNRSEASLLGHTLTEILPEIVDAMPERRLSGNGDAVVALYDLMLEPVENRRHRADFIFAPVVDRPGWRILSIHARAATSLIDRRTGRSGSARAAIGAAAMLAHEIKNPLSGIRGAAQLLEASAGDESGQALTRLIRDEVDRIAALVDRMEGFTDDRPVEFGPQNIHAILGHVRDVAKSGFCKTIPIRELYDPSLPEVRGNRDLLIQIFLNLLKNAAEALGRGSAMDEIQLTTAYRHGYSATDASGRRVSLPIEVCVIDSGAGAPPDVAEHLFEPFVSSKRSGSGLGLALVAKLVADHGGVVEYAREGRPPRTVLRVLLPRYSGEDA